jgi:hypothetical protein
LASRALVVALVFWVARLLGGATTSALTGVDNPDPITELAAGLILAGALGWATPRLSGSTADRVAIVGIALFANVAAVMIEGAAFAPAASPVDRLPLALLVQALVSLVVAIAAVGLLPGDESRSSSGSRHGPRWWAGRLAATTSVYAVAYFITGGINYALVTGPYYESHADGLVTPAPQVVLGVALVEGLLMSLGMLPLVRHLRAKRRASLIASGLVLSARMDGRR